MRKEVILCIGHHRCLICFLQVQPFESTLYPKLINAETYKKLERKKKQQRDKEKADGEWKDSTDDEDKEHSVQADLG